MLREIGSEVLRLINITFGVKGPPTVAKNVTFLFLKKQISKPSQGDKRKHKSNVIVVDVHLMVTK